MSSSRIQSLFDSFTQSVQTHPDKIAILFKKDQGYQSVTFQNIYDRSLKFQNILRQHHVQSGDKVCVVLENSPEFAYVFFALMAEGIVAVLLDAQLSAGQMKKFYEHSGAKLFVTSMKNADKVKEERMALCVVDSVDVLQAMNQTQNVTPSLSIDPHQPAVFFYTSGTTDLPKAVMLSHANLLSNVRAIQQLNLVTDKDVVLSMLPLHHAYPLTVTLLTPLLLGATIAYPSGFVSTELLGCMKETHVTVFVGVPEVFSVIRHSIVRKMELLPAWKRSLIKNLAKMSYGLRQITGVNLSKKIFAPLHQTFGTSLRFMVSGGAKLDKDVARDFLQWGFTILEGYGLTETAPVVAFNTLEHNKLGSVGKPLMGVEVKIIDANEEGIGEIVVRGPNVMLGYYQLTAETQKVIQDGWFHTGDLGTIDAQGFVTIRGRQNELIVLRNGKYIYPEEVEKQYARIPFIKEIGVLSTRMEGLSGGTEQLVALIVPNEDYFKERNETGIRGKLTWELENISAQLPTYQRIKGFALSKDPLPRTRLGKLMRYRLEQMYQHLSKQESQEHKPAEVSKAVDNSRPLEIARTFLEQILKKKVNLKDHLELDLGLDSLNRIELLLQLQDRLGLKITDEEAMEFFMSATVEDLANKLKKIMESSNLKMEDGSLNWHKALHESPKEETLKKIKIEFGVLAIIFNLVMITLLKIIFFLLFFVRAQGRANLPKQGPYLICPNHTSYLDGLLVLVALPFSVALRTYFVGFSQFFENAVLRPIIPIARLIPLEMSSQLIEALKSCSYVLRKGKMVCYFPEGQRSIDGEVKEFKKGVGILVKELNVPVVPVYLDGAFKTWNRTMKGPRIFTPVKVKFGPVLDFPEGKLGILDEAIYETIASKLRKKVIELKPPQV
jgi:long-chain acyl-CoA synthetase